MVDVARRASQAARGRSASCLPQYCNRFSSLFSPVLSFSPCTLLACYLIKFGHVRIESAEVALVSKHQNAIFDAPCIAP